MNYINLDLGLDQLQNYSSIMQNFDIRNIPTLDVCVMGALELFQETNKLPFLSLGISHRPLVVGSVNAFETSRILFEDRNAILSNESSYINDLKRKLQSIDAGVIISASGGKHSPEIIKNMRGEIKDLEIRLLTCNPSSDAAKLLDKDKVFVFPSQREPYTYNTSTYMGMILSKTKEDPKYLMNFIEDQVKNIDDLNNLGNYNEFYLMVPDRFDKIRGMLQTKFVELFGTRIAAHIFTPEQSKHATTVVPSLKKLFVYFGVPNENLSQESLEVPLPENANYGAMMAIGYYIIGQLQSQKPAWFTENIVRYCHEASNRFNQKISPIVEVPA